MPRYKIIENYRNDDKLRNNFFKFTEAVFQSYDFKIWHDKGFWTDEYVPHSIVKDGEVISNVSISTMKIYVNGELKNGLQFATVGTLNEHRKQGLSREIMNYVLDKYKDWAQVHFLFGNNNVLSFYPLFGFQLYEEKVFRSLSDLPVPKFSARKLNLNSNEDYDLIKEKIQSRKCISKLFGAEDYGFVTHWHLLNVFPNDIYYVGEDDLIVIATEESGELHVWDIIYTTEFDLKEVLKKVVSKKVKAVNYYFSPDMLKFAYDEAGETVNSPLFIIEDIGLNEKHFKFPTTAQT